jgi:hypothetical protein
MGLIFSCYLATFRLCRDALEIDGALRQQEPPYLGTFTHSPKHSMYHVVGYTLMLRPRPARCPIAPPVMGVRI